MAAIPKRNKQKSQKVTSVGEDMESDPAVDGSVGGVKSLYYIESYIEKQYDVFFSKN